MEVVLPTYIHRVNVCIVGMYIVIHTFCSILHNYEKNEFMGGGYAGVRFLPISHLAFYDHKV